MNTELSFQLNRQIRNLLRKKIGSRVFDRSIVQQILGFRKEASTIVDRFSNIQLEYDYLTDIGHSLFFSGGFEQEEIGLLSQMVVDDRPIILDIGANIGWHSISWAKARPTSKIFAFEPDPETYTLLQRNISRNRLSQQIFPIPKALSNQPGTLPFFQSKDNAYSSLKNTQRREITNQILVPVTTIDEFVETYQLEHISLIKIDVEGLETQVIQGSLSTLKRLTPDLFVEIYGGQNSNPDPEATVQLICSLNYKAFTIQNTQVVPYEKHSDLNYNYYFTQK